MMVIDMIKIYMLESQNLFRSRNNLRFRLLIFLFVHARPPTHRGCLVCVPCVNPVNASSTRHCPHHVASQPVCISDMRGADLSGGGCSDKSGENSYGYFLPHSPYRCTSKVTEVLSGTWSWNCGHRAPVLLCSL